jgi:hypothetical protein
MSRGTRAVPPMLVAEAQAFMQRVLLPLCEVFPDGPLYSEAIAVLEERGWTFYDSLIVRSAAAAKCCSAKICNMEGPSAALKFETRSHSNPLRKFANVSGDGDRHVQSRQIHG